MSSSRLVFRVDEVRDKQGLSASLELTPEEFLPGGAPDPASGSPTLLAGPVRAEIELSLGGTRLLANARLTGSWLLPCSRCLRDTAAPFEAVFEETYPFDKETLDLNEDLRGAAILEIPQRSVCSDCPGFRSEWGDKPPADAPEKASPFDVLKQLKKRK